MRDFPYVKTLQIAPEGFYQDGEPIGYLKSYCVTDPSERVTPILSLYMLFVRSELPVTVHVDGSVVTLTVPDIADPLVNVPAST